MLSTPESIHSPHRILLTFDDGPHPVHTVSILAELARRDLPAVFFVVGESLEAASHRSIVERASRDGHIIGNHGYSHTRLTSLTDDQIRAEFLRTDALIGGLDGGVKLWRPPFGDEDRRVDSVLTALGYTRLLWNIDSFDWNDDTESWIDRVVTRIQLRQARGFRNTVCLLHDALARTAAQFAEFLDRLDALPDARLFQYDPNHTEGLSLRGADKQPAPLYPADASRYWVDDSLIVARASVNTLYVLNPSAGVLLDIIADGASAAEAADVLADTYGISPDMASRDVHDAIDDWKVRGLLGPKAPELEDPGPWIRSMDEMTAARVEHFACDRAYRFLDHRFHVRFETAHLEQIVHARFANLIDSSPSLSGAVYEVVVVGNACALRLPDGAVTRHPSPAALGYRLLFEIMRAAHPQLDPMACLHSALIGNGATTLALIGNNGSGKSTLTAALASTGRQIFTDDRLFLDFTTGLPAAAPNAISLKRGSWAPLRPRYPALDDLPILSNEGEEIRFLLTAPPVNAFGPPVSHVFFPRYAASAMTSALPLSSVQAIEQITVAESWVSSDPQRLGAFLNWIHQARCYALPFSDLDLAMQEVEACLRS